MFDAYPRSGDIPFMVELERPLALKAGETVRLKVVIDGTCCVIYANETIALSTRIYNLKAGQFGGFVMDGAAEFTDLSIAF